MRTPRTAVIEKYKQAIVELSQGAKAAQVSKSLGIPGSAFTSLRAQGLLKRNGGRIEWAGKKLTTQQIHDAAILAHRGATTAHRRWVANKRAGATKEQPTYTPSSSRSAITTFVDMLMNGKTHSAKDVIEAHAAYKQAIKSL